MNDCHSSLGSEARVPSVLVRYIVQVSVSFGAWKARMIAVSSGRGRNKQQNDSMSPRMPRPLRARDVSSEIVTSERRPVILDHKQLHINPDLACKQWHVVPEAVIGAGADWSDSDAGMMRFWGS